jgi:hypothetical protein
MSFQLATLRGEAVPAVDELDVADAEASFEKGALLIITAGELAEVGENPTEVDGVALTAYGPEPASLSGAGGFNRLGTRGFPPGRMQFIRPRKGLRFSAEFVGDVEAATVGTFYGVTLGADGLWRVDFAKLANDVVELISKDWNQMLSYDYEHEATPEEVTLGRNRVIVEFIPAVTEAE